MKKILASLTMAGMLVAGGTGVAWAAGSGDSGGQAPATTTPGAAACPAPRALPRGALLKAAADAIGIQQNDLVTAVRGGKTVAAIAGEHGVDPNTVVQAVVSAGTQQIDQAVSNGTIDSARADRLKQRLGDVANRLVNQTPQAGKPAQASGGRRGILKGAINTAASTIGVSTAELKQAVKGGKSIADVAQAHHVSDSTVVDAVVKSLDQQIDQLAANGTITADRATKLKSNVPKRVDELVHGQLHKGARACRNGGGAGSTGNGSSGMTPSTDTSAT